MEISPLGHNEDRDERADDEYTPFFGIMDAVNAVLKRRWLIVGGVFLCVLATGIYYKLQPSIYTATARFLPSRTQDMSSRIDRAFGTGDYYNPYEGDTIVDYYSNLLMSRPFLQRVIEKKFAVGPQKTEMDLMTFFGVTGADAEERLTKTVNRLASDLRIQAPRDQGGYGRPPSIMSVSFSSTDPQLAAQVANEVLAQLTVYVQDIRDSKAATNRKFIENQLDENQELLKKAEAAYAAFMMKNKRIVTTEVEVERDRLKRNVTVQEEVFVTLKRQLELAKIEEQEKRPSIEIIDQAIAPLGRSYPYVRRKVALAGILSVLMMCVLAIGLEIVRKIDFGKAENRELNRNLTYIRNDFRKAARVLGLQKRRTPPP